MTSAFDRIGERVRPEDKQFVRKALDISEQIMLAIKSHPKINSQRKLAKELGKSEAEISKWMSGLHNLTLESITKIEAVLGVDIILTDKKAKEKYTAQTGAFTALKKAIQQAAAERVKSQVSAMSTSFINIPHHGSFIDMPIHPNKTVIYLVEDIDETDIFTGGRIVAKTKTKVHHRETVVPFAVPLLIDSDY